MNAAMSRTEASDEEVSMPEARAWPGACLVDDDEQRGSAEPVADKDLPLETRPGLCVAATAQQFADWIEAIVNQDERALAALYDASFWRVFALVQRIVRNVATAEEVVEDVYFQIWRQAVRFDPARGKALAWVMAIARSRALDALRCEARFKHECLDDDVQPMAGGHAMAADELLDLARHQSDLHQALMLLDSQPRQLVSLAFLRGLSHEEIAQQTQLPLGTVKSHIRRALLSLREILGEKGRPGHRITGGNAPVGRQFLQLQGQSHHAF